MKLTQKKNKGFTLIEILLVVGFIALASIGVYAIYTKVQTANAANSEGRNIDLIRSGIKTLYGSQTSYGAAAASLNTVINNARITPETMRVTGTPGAIVNSFGGAVSVSVIGLGTGMTNNAFQIKTALVPGAVCSKLAASASANFDQVRIIGATTVVVKTFGSPTIDVAGIANTCNADTVTIDFESL